MLNGVSSIVCLAGSRKLLRILIAVLIFCIHTAHVQAAPLRYVALGDSYTTGTGVAAQETWPSLLTEKLRQAGIDIELAANLGQNGWTARQVLKEQTPLLKNEKPDFVTLLVGVNDWIRGGAPSRLFTRNVQRLLDRIEKSLTPSGTILLVTIPDFSCSPSGKKWGYGKSAPNGMTRLNRILKSEASARGWPVADIFDLSQKLCTQPGMFAADDLHPSGRQYALWVERIFPAALELLKKNKKE